MLLSLGMCFSCDLDLNSYELVSTHMSRLIISSIDCYIDVKCISICSSQ
jgi:hypothetical protein